MATLQNENRYKNRKLLDKVTVSNRNPKTFYRNVVDAEQMATYLLRRENWSVRNVILKENFNLELFRPGEYVAAKIVNGNKRVELSQIEKFLGFLSSGRHKFTSGICISTTGFTPSVYSFLRSEGIANLKLAILDDSKLIYNCEELDREQDFDRSTFIGVFTCKGGVGKTTISAHLAGALALNGYDVSLIDLDHQQNLSKLLGKGVYIPPFEGRGGARIAVGDANTWRQAANRRTKYVVSDCNPEFDQNPLEFVKRFDYCIVPTNLSPLGINKNADVIKRTFDLIRRVNTQAHLFVLLNGVQAEEAKRNAILNKALRTHFAEFAARDSRCHYIDPSHVSIRFSKQLLYWGYHLFDGTAPTLGFKRFGKYSYPRMDFLKLVDYLESKTELNSEVRTVAARM